MGEDLNLCAADSFGKVHGHHNLFVNDASLLCTAPGVNPQGTSWGSPGVMQIILLESSKT